MPACRGSLVKSRKSPITGAIVVADVVLKASPDGADAGPPAGRSGARDHRRLPPRSRAHKVPAVIRFVPALPMSATGKLRAPCVTSSSPAAAAVSASRSRSSSRPPAIAPSRSRARKAASWPRRSRRPRGPARNALQFLPFDLDDIDAMPRFVAALRKSVGPIYGLVNNAALGDDGALSLMHTAKIERLVRLNTLSPDGPHQIRGARDDGGRRRPHRQRRLDRRLHRLQRAFGLRRDQGVDARLHALAGARGRPHGRQRQRGGAGVSRHRHDAGPRRRRSARRSRAAARCAGCRRSATSRRRSSSCSATAPPASPAPC